MVDQEIEAMSAIAGILSKLEKPAVFRVLHWAASRFEISGVENRGAFMEKGETIGSGSPGASDSVDLPSFFGAANPQTSAEDALVVGYWFQEQVGQKDVEGFSVNKELRSMGRGVKNITRAFETLMEQKPQLAIQVRKSGTSKQARKTYRITTEGIRKVESMLGDKQMTRAEKTGET